MTTKEEKAEQKEGREILRSLAAYLEVDARRLEGALLDLLEGKS